MDVKTIAAGILLLMVAFIVSVQAIELRISDDSIYISSTEGRVFVYVKNTATEVRNLLISADGNQLNAFVDAYQTIVRAGATGGAYVHISAPDCFRGSEAVQINAQLCSADACETATRKVVVNVEPAKFCPTYIEGFAPRVQFISGSSCGSSGCFAVRTLEPRQSSLVSTNSFDATSYNLRITGGDSCTELKRGVVGRATLQVFNRGAAGNFEVRAISGSEVEAFPSKDYLSLQRSDVDGVSVDFKPFRDAFAGRHFITLQLLHLDELIAEKALCVDLFDEFEGTLVAPSAVTAKTSRDVVIQVELSNEGTSVQKYIFSAFNEDLQHALTVVPEEFSLKPGAAKLIEVRIDTSDLPAGSYRLKYLASSPDSESTAETMLKVEEDSSAGASALDVDAVQEQKESTVTITATIRNEGTSDLRDLDLEVTGLPSSWKVSAIPPISVAAKSEKEVKFDITTGSSEVISPMLEISRNGKVLASQKLPQISGKTGGFTGLFTLSSQDVLLGLLILAAIALFFIVGRREDASGHIPHNLESIKHEATGGHSEHGHVH